MPHDPARLPRAGAPAGADAALLEQRMAAGEEADEQSFDGPVLSDDDPLDLEQGSLEQGGIGARRGAGPW